MLADCWAWDTGPHSGWYLPPFLHPEISHRGYVALSSMLKIPSNKLSFQDIGGF